MIQFKEMAVKMNFDKALYISEVYEMAKMSYPFGRVIPLYQKEGVEPAAAIVAGYIIANISSSLSDKKLLLEDALRLIVLVGGKRHVALPHQYEDGRIEIWSGKNDVYVSSDWKSNWIIEQ